MTQRTNYLDYSSLNGLNTVTLTNTFISNKPSYEY